ncbi:hypothetical protein BGZ65_007394 [Modicella reniformis]|uniref:Mitochondrial carrier protein n=1 Tax=Modicella reniformis TaxID=1440133 RepID=A0A9P6MB98_9FUNG|nr:hypothetical protein BGZ65_007394 [Modicella reniformis]
MPMERTNRKILDGIISGHIIGWALSGACAIIATAISLHLLYRHAKNYNKPSEQRHIMRIVLMVPIYAIISFLSFRFYKHSIYFETIRDCYEAFVIYSFFILLLTYLGDDNEVQRSKITGSDRRKLLYPLNCFYYNPLHENFLNYMKYGILQYVAIKPLCTLAAVILEYYGLYCATSYDFHFGMVYITIINFTSVSVALYCLVLFYQTINLEIQDHYVFKPENNWSVMDVELGISAVLICVEMVVFSILHVYSFSYRPYVISGKTTPIWKSLIDGFNPVDIVREIIWACQETLLLIQGKSLPVRDGHLNFKLKRAHTIRLLKRHRFFKNRKAAVDPKAAAIYQTSLDGEGTLDAADDEELARASLLQHADVLTQKYTGFVIPSWFNDVVAGTVGGWAQVVSGTREDSHSTFDVRQLGLLMPEVRLQTQPNPPKYNGAMDCLRITLKEEGLGGLYKGVTSPLMGIGICNAVMFAANGTFRRILQGGDETKTLAILDIGIAGSMAGGVMAFVNCPVELLKVKLQTQYGPATGTVVVAAASAAAKSGVEIGAVKPYTGVLDAGIRTFRQQGLKGLYRGMDITLMRDIPSFFSYFVTYEGSKRILAHFNHHDNIGELSTPELLLAGGIAGFGAWIPCYPQDVIKSRMQSSLKYRNTLECFRSLRTEAASGNWRVWFKGFGPTMARAFPANAATFFFYELTMKFMRGE